MGWSAGAELLDKVWDEVKSYIPDTNRDAVVEKLIDHFTNLDCDVIHESKHRVIRTVYESFCCPECGDIREHVDGDWRKPFTGRRVHDRPECQKYKK